MQYRNQEQLSTRGYYGNSTGASYICDDAPSTQRQMLNSDMSNNNQLLHTTISNTNNLFLLNNQQSRQFGSHSNNLSIQQTHGMMNSRHGYNYRQSQNQFEQDYDQEDNHFNRYSQHHNLPRPPLSQGVSESNHHHDHQSQNEESGAAGINIQTAMMTTQNQNQGITDKSTSENTGISDEQRIFESAYYKDASLIMTNTCFSQISFQLFFLLFIAQILWNVSYHYNLGFLWAVDLFSIYLTSRRINLNQQFLKSSNIPRNTSKLSIIAQYFEIFYSIMFKICLLIHLEYESYKFFIVPAVLMLYVIFRGCYIIHQKIQQDSSIMSDIFIWGFKLFLSVQILLVSLKYEGMILWKWRDVFWAYWVFFSIMVGINIGFIIILFSKCYSKCSEEDEQESYELKGLFWMFMISNALTVNTTIYVTGLISFYDDHEKNGIFFGFQYGVAFVIFMLCFSFFFRRAIKITREEELANEENEGIAGQNRNNQDKISQSNEQQQNPQQGEDDDDIDIDNEQQQEISRSEGSVADNQQNNNEEIISRQKVKPKKILRIAVSDKINGFPLFFQKLSSTYFKSFSAVPKNENTKNKLASNASIKPEKTDNQRKSKHANSKANTYKIPIKSASFMSPKDSERNGVLEDLSQETKRKSQLARREQKRLSSAINSSTNQSGTYSVRGLGGVSMQESQLRQMALDTEEKYQNFLVSSKGQEIQKKIYETRLEDECLKANICLSFEEKRQQFFKQNEEDYQGDLELDILSSNDIDENNQNKQQQDQQQKLQDKQQQQSKSQQQKYNNNTPISPSQQDNNNLHITSNIYKIMNPNQSTNMTQANQTNPNHQFIKSFTCENKQVALNNLDNSVANVCVVCFDKPPDTVYMPCGHGGLCYECGIDILKKTAECYLCRNVINEVYQVDLKSREGKNFKVLAVTQLVDDSSMHPDSNPSFDNYNRMQGQLPGSPNCSIASPQSPGVFSRGNLPSVSENIENNSFHENAFNIPPISLSSPQNYFNRDNNNRDCQVQEFNEQIQERSETVRQLHNNQQPMVEVQPPQISQEQKEQEQMQVEIVEPTGTIQKEQQQQQQQPLSSQQQQNKQAQFADEIGVSEISEEEREIQEESTRNDSSSKNSNPSNKTTNLASNNNTNTKEQPNTETMDDNSMHLSHENQQEINNKLIQISEQIQEK